LLKKASEAAVASAARSSSSLKANKRKIPRRFTPRNDEPKEFFNNLLEESPADKKNFRETVIRIALTMERLGFGTDRSRFIASTLQSWLDKGI